MTNCYSYRQFCSLGPLPPRTPARADPQVPKDRKLGACAHGKIGSFYFYADGSQDDAAFGFCDIEVSVQRVAGDTVRLEIYCVADGYQSARGVGAEYPLTIAVLAGERVLSVAHWHFADVICGHADPMHFEVDLAIAEEAFSLIDRIELQATRGLCRSCE